MGASLNSGCIVTIHKFITITKLDSINVFGGKKDGHVVVVCVAPGENCSLTLRATVPENRLGLLGTALYINTGSAVGCH